MSGVLLISIVYPPNTGGVETHLSDLASALAKRNWDVSVLTYKPITTKTSSNVYEKRGKVEIFRLPWISGLFYKLVDKPILEFVYLIPGLFLIAPLLLFLSGKKIKTIHGQGLIGGCVSVFWGKLFGKRVVISIHNVYEFPKGGLYRIFAKMIFENADYVLGLSKKAVSEIKSLGISKHKLDTFTYWIDLNKFKAQNSKLRTKEKLGWGNRFVVLFVGRLVAEKGILELLKANRIWNKDILLAVAGTGPLVSNVKSKMSKVKNLDFLGRIDNERLPNYYNAADIVIVPSTHEEGFGRVILESLACGTPVIASKRGAIPEAMDETVGELISVNPENIKRSVEYYFKNPDKLRKLSNNARSFAVKRYSEKNVEKIIEAYTD